MHKVNTELHDICKEHHTNLVNKNINHLLKGKPLQIGDNRFNCPLKYLKHEIQHPQHEYSDTKLFEKSLSRLQEHMRNLEQQKQMDIHHGPTL